MWKKQYFSPEHSSPSRFRSCFSLMGLLARFILGPQDKKGSASAWSVVLIQAKLRREGRGTPAIPNQASMLPSIKASRRVAEGCTLLDISGYWRFLEEGMASKSVCLLGSLYAITVLLNDIGLFACINVNTKCIY